MKKQGFIYLLTFMTLISSSCSKILQKEDEQVRIDKKIDLPGITKLHAESICHIELIQDKQNYIIASGNKDQLNKLNIENEGASSYLRHHYKNLVKNNRPIKLEIHLKDITHIQIDAPVKISASKLISTPNLNILVNAKSELVEMDLHLNCDRLSFHVKGHVSAQYQFAGECQKANYVLNGSSNIMASEFKTQTINISQNGVGTAYLYAEKNITANIFSSGDIYYKGQPKLVVKRVKINNQSPTSQLIML